MTDEPAQHPDTDIDIPKPHLPVHEWMAVLTILLFLGTLTLCIVFSPKQTAPSSTTPPHFMVDQNIEVIIEGAVEHPGVHTLARGAKISDLLKKAIPLPEADLKTIKTERELRSGQTVKVPQIKSINIQLTGAVHPPYTVTVPKGTRVQDLLEKVQFKEDADLSKLRRKRLLKQGEVIHVAYIDGR